MLLSAQSKDFSSRRIILWNSSSDRAMAIQDCCCGPVVKNPPANKEDTWDADSIPGSGRLLGEGHGIALQYTCLEKSRDRKAWWATVHGVTEQLSTNRKQSYDFSIHRGWLPGKCHLSYVNEYKWRQWDFPGKGLRIRLAKQGMQVPTLVRELRSSMLWSN